MMPATESTHLPPGCKVIVLPEQQAASPMFSTLPEVMTCKQAAEALCICEKKMRELALAEKVLGFRVGKVWRFSRQSLVDFVEGGGYGSA